MSRDGLPRGGRRRAWVKAQRLVGSGFDRLDHPRRRRKGRLVGVELDPALTVGRLLARDVRLKAGEALSQEAFRHSSRNVSRASRGLTFCSRYPTVSYESSIKRAHRPCSRPRLASILLRSSICQLAIANSAGSSASPSALRQPICAESSSAAT